MSTRPAIPSVTRFRMSHFPDLATANASTALFGWGDIIAIDGDTTRYKVGMGFTISVKKPAAPTGKTFANLPWVNTNGSASNTPPNTYAANATATLTAAQLINKYLTSTSAAATSLTLPTATLLGTALGAVKGTSFEFTLDNTAGANTVTIVVGANITAGTPVITGGGTLTIAAGQVGRFYIFFTSPTAALIYRLM